MFVLLSFIFLYNYSKECDAKKLMTSISIHFRLTKNGYSLRERGNLNLSYLVLTTPPNSSSTLTQHTYVHWSRVIFSA